MSSTPPKAGESSSSALPSEEPGHSTAVGNFLTNLVGAYETQDGETIDEAAQSLIRALTTEKKIVKKNVEIKKDAKLVEDLNGLGLEREEENKEDIKE